jgi:hypothetical protein
MTPRPPSFPPSPSPPPLPPAPPQLLLVRAVHSCLRLLPCHKMAVQLLSRNATMGLKYRLSSSLAAAGNEAPLVRARV